MADKPLTHQTEVFRIKEIFKHENADKMEILKIYGFTCCVGKGQFKVGDLAAFIQPDSIVPPTDDYNFLRSESDGDDFPVRRRRIKVRRLRGVISQGLVVAAPDGSKEGDDVSDILQITHYDPEVHSGFAAKGMGGEQDIPPDGYNPEYDIDTNFNRYGFLLQEGEEIVCTEKVHGSNVRFKFSKEKNKFYCGSHRRWLRGTMKEQIFFKNSFWEKLKFRLSVLFGKSKVSLRKGKNVWWDTLIAYPNVAKFIRDNPDCVIYGEVYGPIQKGYHYGSKEDVRFFAFDILRGNEFVGWDESQEIANDYQIPWVPLRYRGPYSEVMLRDLAEKDSIASTLEGGVQEGLVIKPIPERTELRIGRVQLKLISNRYYESKDCQFGDKVDN